MPIDVDCPCGQRLAVPKKKIGQPVNCPRCGAEIIVPVPVWTPVVAEALPELKPPQPAFSGYTLPPPKAPSLLVRVKPWVLGALLAVLIVASLSGLIYGLSRLRKIVEPPTEAQPTRAAVSNGAE